MQALITSYLIQKKECNLPLLGHFRIKTKPAELDRANKQIFPPTDEILYSEFAANLSADLIEYVSVLQDITSNDAREKINNWCNYAKEKIDSGEKLIFDSIGSLQRDAVGNIFFQRKKGSIFFESVSAESTFYKNSDHPVLVGDTETNSGVMHEFYREEIVQKKAWWKISAIALLIVSLLVLFFSFYVHKFSETGIGNRASIPSANPPPALYNSP